MKPEFSEQTRLLWKFKDVHHLHGSLIQAVLAGLGLHFGQPRILFTVEDMQGATQKELAEKLQVTAASLAMSLKRLQKAGFLEKSADDQDLRRNKIVLTEKGRQASQACRRTFGHVDARMFQDFTPAELEQFRSFLQRIEANIGTIEVDAHDF